MATCVRKRSIVPEAWMMLSRDEIEHTTQTPPTAEDMVSLWGKFLRLDLHHTTHTHKHTRQDGTVC